MSAMKPSTLRIGYRYRPKRLAPEYDAVVIGSGMGGLTTAALLSDLGWKVCVLEQHYTAGGYTHSYERNGYQWDVGVHYIGDVGAQTRTRRMFDFLSDGALEWAPMTFPSCSTIFRVTESSATVSSPLQRDWATMLQTSSSRPARVISPLTQS